MYTFRCGENETTNLQLLYVFVRYGTSMSNMQHVMWLELRTSYTLHRHHCLRSDAFK